MKISNFKELATTQARTDGLTVLNAGLEAIDTRAAIHRTVSLSGSHLSIAGTAYDTATFSRIRVAGAGKCSGDAACALAEILGERLSDGVVIDIHEHEMPSRIALFVGSHPLSEEKNVMATAHLLSFLEDSTEKDLVIVVVSGGGSALLCQPGEGMTVVDEANIVSSLMRAGATIQETNSVRKHLSKARGGGIAKYAYPATLVALIFSDVPGDDIAFISSGPTVRDETTITDAEKVLSKYSLTDARRFLIETPKEKKFFEKVSNIVVVSNAVALDAMKQKSADLGYCATIVTATLSGEAREVSRDIVSRLHGEPEKAVLLFGGETTVASGEARGVGGRNQEVALAGLAGIKSGELLIACASDGRDNTDAAGALCDTDVAMSADIHGMSPEDFLARHDSYAFFKATGGHIITGDTGSNVSDLIIALK